MDSTILKITPLKIKRVVPISSGSFFILRDDIGGPVLEDSRPAELLGIGGRPLTSSSRNYIRQQNHIYNIPVSLYNVVNKQMTNFVLVAFIKAELPRWTSLHRLTRWQL